MLKLKIMSQEEYDRNQREKEKYTIGESPLEMMDEAVKLEYEKGIYPSVSQEQTNVKKMSLERYSALLAIYCMQKFGKGELDLCPDGCKSDLMYSLDKERYLGIQIKSTSGYNKDMYWRFGGLGKDYNGLLLFLHSVKDGKSWLIPYIIFKRYYNASVSISADKNRKKINKDIDWDNYKVETKDLASKIFYYYSLAVKGDENLKIHSLDEISLPIGGTTQKEHMFHKRIIPFLEKTNLGIIKPKLEGMVYDFILGKLKVQEKTASKDNGLNSFTASIYRSLKVPYIVSDFDLLLIHLPESFTNFYLIPMNKLYENGYLKNTKEEKGRKSLALYPPEKIEDTKKDKASEWTLNYLCYFEDPNLSQRIIEIYYKQINKDPTPVILKKSIFWDKECKNFNDLVIKWNLNRDYPKMEENMRRDNRHYQFLLDGKKVAIKRIRIVANGKNFELRVSISENRLAVPCKEGDFDYVYTELPEQYGGFYLFPAIKFKEKEMFQTETNIGKKTITIHFPDKIIKGCSMNRDFIFYFNDPNIKEKLTNLLKTY